MIKRSISKSNPHHGRTVQSLSADGGRLCLDFVNTAIYGDVRIAHDFLGGFDDLLKWGELLRLVSLETAANLRTEAAANPEKATRTLALARNLRAAIRDVFTPHSPAVHIETGLEVLNAFAPRALKSVGLILNGRDIRFAPGEGLDTWLTAPLVVSALELAVSTARADVRQCQGEGCRWLFQDVSRNGSRQWCSVERCGNQD